MTERELLIRAGLGAIGFLIIYLLTSFVKLTFNISNWDEETRFMMALFGIGLSALLSTYPGYKFKNKE